MRPRFDPWVGKIPWRRKWQPTPVFLSGKSHGQRSLAGYSSWIHKGVRHKLATKHLQQQYIIIIGLQNIFLLNEGKNPAEITETILFDCVKNRDF